MSDLKFALRQLLKNPGFTAVAVLTLALGIGANTAIFSYVDFLLMRPLPVEEPGRLVTLGSPEARGENETFHYPLYRELRDGNSVLEGLAACDDLSLNLTVGAATERVSGLVVSGNYFDVLGVTPALGRAFLPEEDRTPGTHAVAVISHALWLRSFAGDPDVLGRAIRINAQHFSIIGVTPASFHGTIAGRQPEVFVPLMMYPGIAPGGEFGSPLESRFMLWLRLLGRLKPGVSLEEAQAGLAVVLEQIREVNPENVGHGIVLRDGSQGHNRNLIEARLPLLLTQVTVGLLLLIACANVANLLLARAASRRREIAVRVAVGASRARVLGQLLSEGVLLALVGGAAGLLVAVWLNRFLSTFRPPGSSTALDVPVDLRVLAFALGLSAVTGVLAALVPALQSSRADVVKGLKDGAAGLTGGPRRWSWSRFLVVVQAALSVVVLVVAGLCVRSVQKLNAVRTGFDPTQVLLCGLDVDSANYSGERGRIFYQQLLERVRALPGVEAASLARNPVLGRSSSSITVRRFDDLEPIPGQPPAIDFNVVSPDYFRTLGAPLVRGREFQPADTENSPLIVIVNETFANKFWPGQNPIGKRIFLPDMRHISRTSSVSMDNPPEIAREVIGVVKDSKYRSLSESPRPFMFWPLEQSYDGRLTLQARSALPTDSLLAAIHGQVRALDPHLPLFQVRTLAQQKSDSIFLQRMLANLLGGFGLLGLVLSGLGIYGVLACAVSQRTREIGVRMALGAHATDVLALIIRQGLGLVAIGLGAGLILALPTARLLGDLLHEVAPTDPATFATVCLLVIGAALLACWLPARRAARVNPMVALRSE